MQQFITYIAKGFRLLYTKARLSVNQIFTWWKYYSNNVQFEDFQSNGIPFVMIARGGKCSIGKNFRTNNGNLGNPIGRADKCILFVDKNATLVIGDNVGISSTAIIAHLSITIGNGVHIGGGVCIYDTDFHSLDAAIRKNSTLDHQNKKKAPVIIMDNAFIGAHSTILKGVTIGENAIIGACSVVTKNIPANQIWAGNPAKFIREI